MKVLVPFLSFLAILFGVLASVDPPKANASPVLPKIVTSQAEGAHRGVARVGRGLGLGRVGLGLRVGRFGLFAGVGITNRALFAAHVNAVAVRHVAFRHVRFLGPPIVAGYGGVGLAYGGSFGYAPQAGAFSAGYGSGCCGGCCGLSYAPPVQAVAPCQPQIEYSAPAPCAPALSYAAPACGVGAAYGGYAGGLGYGLGYGLANRFGFNFHGGFGHRSVAFRRF